MPFRGARRVLPGGRGGLYLAVSCLTVFAFACLVGILAILNSSDVDGNELTTGQYFDLLQQGRIQTATILTPQNLVHGIYDRGIYWLSIPSGLEGELISQFETAGIAFKEEHLARSTAVIPLGMVLLSLLLVDGFVIASLAPRRYAVMISRANRRSRWLRRLVPLFVVSIGVISIPILLMSPSTPGREIRLDQYITLLRQGRIQSATFLEVDKRVSGQYDRGSYWLAVSLPALRSTVESKQNEAGVESEVQEQTARSLIRPGAVALGIVVLLLGALIVGTLTVDPSIGASKQDRPQPGSHGPPFEERGYTQD
jgi:hypothetical protein